MASGVLPHTLPNGEYPCVFCNLYTVPFRSQDLKNGWTMYICGNPACMQLLASRYETLPPATTAAGPLRYKYNDAPPARDGTADSAQERR